MTGGRGEHRRVVAEHGGGIAPGGRLVEGRHHVDGLVSHPGHRGDAQTRVVVDHVENLDLSPAGDDDEDGDRALELEDEGARLARGLPTGAAQGPTGVDGDDLGLFDARLGDGGQLAGEGEHLVFGLAATPPEPRRDLVGASAHRTRAVPKARVPGQTEALERPHTLGERGHPFGEQTRVGRIRHIAGTTVVSARTLSSRTTLAAFALASSASFNWSTAPSDVVPFAVEVQRWSQLIQAAA